MILKCDPEKEEARSRIFLKCVSRGFQLKGRNGLNTEGLGTGGAILAGRQGAVAGLNMRRRCQRAMYIKAGQPFTCLFKH